MFNTQVVVVLVPQSSVAALQACAVPVLRQHQHDDVLPELPEDVEQLPQHTLHRPAAAWAQQDWIADASDAFSSTHSQDGLVITASRSKDLSADSGVLAIHSRCRPPWHAHCQHIKPRGCSVAAVIQQQASARARQRLLQQQQQQQQQRGRDTAWWPTALVPVALLDEQLFLQDLADAIRAYNIRALQQQQQQQSFNGHVLPLIVPILLQTVQQTAAAVAVQSAWRAHSSRVQQHIAQRILCNRAACAVQRAWRAFVLRRRLCMLSAVAAAYRHAQTQLRFSCIMCLDVAGIRLLQAAAEACRKGSALFPEHRLWLAMEPEGGDLFLVEPVSSSSSSDSDGASDQTTSSSSSATGSANSSPVRKGLPAWTGAGIPVIPADCSAAAGALSRAHAAKLLEQNCSVKDLLDPAHINAGRCSPQDVAQLITFSSKIQAAQRAALLAAYTYDVRTGCYTQLMTVQESPLRAAYRKLTGLSATSTTAVVAVPSASGAAISNSSTGGKGGATSTAAAAAGGEGSLIPAAARPAKKSKAPLTAHSAKPTRRQVPCIKQLGHGVDTAAETQASSDGGAVGAGAAGAGAVSGGTPCWTDAAASSSSAGAAVLTARSQGYAIPLQPIRPTDSLLAAVQGNTAGAACSNAAGSDPGSCCQPPTVAASGLHFYISLLSRCPYLLKELVAAEAESWTARDAAAAAGQSATPAAALMAAPAAADDAAAAEAGDSSSADAQQQDNSSCLSSQPPSTIQAKPGAKSLGAYLQRTQQQQVHAFKLQLADEAAAAAAEAAAACLAQQQAVAAARDAEAVADTSPALLSTSNVANPDYWPASTAEAAAATQASRNQTQAEAAARVAELRQQQQLQLEEAMREEQARRAAAKAAAQHEKQACHQELQQEQQHRQAAAQHRVGALKHVRAGAPASRKARQQQVATFATACNQLSKHMRGYVVQRARAAQQLAAALDVQEQRGAAGATAAALQQHLQDELSKRQEKAQQQGSSTKAELQAAAAIQELGLAAKRAAAAAARHHYERSRGHDAQAGGT